MTNLINKEIKLSMGIQTWIYLIIGVLVEFAPNYPHYVPVFFLCLGVFMMFQTGVINKDVLFTACLPVKKRDTVKSRVLLVGILELVQLVLTVPLIFLSKFLGLKNDAGIDLNFAFIGLAFVFYTIFNLVFIPSYYKKADRAGVPFLITQFFVWPAMFIFELPVYMQNTNTPIGELGKFLDSSEPAAMTQQLPIVAVGVVIWILGLLISYKVSAKRFEKVDL